MAVPFAFPDENNDAEVIIRQLGLLLSRLAVEFKKQRTENIQLRARNKMQSGIIRQVSARRQENSHAASMNDKVLSAIVTAIPDGRVVAIRRREVNDAKTESSTQIDKTKASTSNSSESSDSQMEEGQNGPLSFIRARLQWHRRWWSWLAPRTLTRNPFWTTAVICVVGWHLLR